MTALPRAMRPAGTVPHWPWSGLQCRLEEVVGCGVERDEADAFDLRRGGPDGGNRDLRGEVGREPVNASGDGGKRDTARTQIVGHVQAAPVARGEGVRL